MLNQFMFPLLTFIATQVSAGEAPTATATALPAKKSVRKNTERVKKSRAAPSLQPSVALPPHKASAAPLLVAKALTPVAIMPAVPTAADIVAKVQNFYNKTKSFNAGFHQTVTNSTFNKLKPKTSKGRVYILKPGKMRWDYKNESAKKASDPKVSKSFISDGKHLWAVMHKNKQYYKEELGESTLPVAVSFLMGTGDLLQAFDPVLDTPGKYGSTSDLLLLLTPKTPSARYKKLWLVIDAKTFAVKQSIVLNTKGDTNAIRFQDIKIDDGSLRKGHFIFNAKAHKEFREIKNP